MKGDLKRLAEARARREAAAKAKADAAAAEGGGAGALPVAAPQTSAEIGAAEAAAKEAAKRAAALGGGSSSDDEGGSMFAVAKKEKKSKKSKKDKKDKEKTEAAGAGLPKLESRDIKKMKPPQLKEALKERGLPIDGNKKTLEARLLEACK